ncbi:MAG: hypothetical protein IJU40_01685 [Desulfovibrionaceae bacterium]|nr:hypothetical protein [Desulfovibrionaceae bacterium]
MEVKYSNNPSLGPGHGYFIVKGEILPTSSYEISLQRSVDKHYLNAKGEWQEADVSLKLNGTQKVDTSLYLELNPTLVNALSSEDNYLLSLLNLPLDAKVKKARFRVQEVNYSTEEALNHSVIPVSKKEVLLEKKGEVLESEESQTPLNLEASPEQMKPKKPLWLILLLGALLLGLLAYVLWDKFFKPKEPEPKEDVPIETTLPQEEVKESLKPKEEEKEKPKQNEELSKPKSETIISLEEQVQQFFKGQERTSSNAVKLAKELKPQNTAEQDAVFRLYYFASEQGETQLLLDYASCLDPSKPKWGTIEKNALEAHRIYTKANTKEAKQALEAMLAWLMAEKEKGNPEAKAWLAKFKSEKITK